MQLIHSKWNATLHVTLLYKPKLAPLAKPFKRNRIWQKWYGACDQDWVKKGKGQTLNIAPQGAHCHCRGAQVHSAHQAASHIPALYLPGHSRYSFTDSERMEGWVSPGPGCKEQLAHDCYAMARSQRDSNPWPCERWLNTLTTRPSLLISIGWWKWVATMPVGTGSKESSNPANGQQSHWKVQTEIHDSTQQDQAPHNKQEALQMQRDRATCHKYEISHLKRLAIG